MNILNLISGNALRGPETVRFPDRKAPVAAYRGNVVMDPEKCIACGICSHVCVSAAIEVSSADDHSEWTYDPARCTFCGACVDHCPVAALTQEPDRGPSYGRPGELAETILVLHPACPDCGKPTMPVGGTAVLSRAFKDVTAETHRRASLCEHCRQKATVSALKKGFGAVSEIEGNDDER